MLEEIGDSGIHEQFLCDLALKHFDEWLGQQCEADTLVRRL